MLHLGNCCSSYKHLIKFCRQCLISIIKMRCVFEKQSPHIANAFNNLIAGCNSILHCFVCCVPMHECFFQERQETLKKLFQLKSLLCWGRHCYSYFVKTFQHSTRQTTIPQGHLSKERRFSKECDGLFCNQTILFTSIHIYFAEKRRISRCNFVKASSTVCKDQKNMQIPSHTFGKELGGCGSNTLLFHCALQALVQRVQLIG
mmetsp:Transcript_10250/g.30856  ORF Transcript_10250/g.30856 Transcript_10250/m.30856 type:complete len:203 (+) Transcript_10250:2513-3121(+)